MLRNRALGTTAALFPSKCDGVKGRGGKWEEWGGGRVEKGGHGWRQHLLQDPNPLSEPGGQAWVSSTLHLRNRGTELLLGTDPLVAQLHYSK